MPTAKPRLMVTLEPAVRRRLDEVAAKMHMRPSTYTAWLLSAIFNNMDAASVLEKGLDDALRAVRMDEKQKAPRGRGSAKTRTTGQRRGAKR